MTSFSQDITHHISEPLLAAYAAGSLDWHYSLVVAAHVSMCDECRARLNAHEAAGGAVMECSMEQDISADCKSDVMSMLDSPAKPDAPVYLKSGVFPAPVMAALKGKPPKWKAVGFGVRQSILHSDASGSVRLLYIPAGEAVPEHGHRGIELTLVLQGSFSDETGRFGVGDVEIAEDDLDHAPIADKGEACICLAATGAPLRFHSLIPRIFQPIFRI